MRLWVVFFVCISFGYWSRKERKIGLVNMCKVIFFYVFFILLNSFRNFMICMLLFYFVGEEVEGGRLVVLVFRVWVFFNEITGYFCMKKKVFLFLRN